MSTKETYSEWLERIYGEEKSVTLDKESVIRSAEAGDLNDVPFNERLAIFVTEEEYNTAQAKGAEKKRARAIRQPLASGKP